MVVLEPIGNIKYRVIENSLEIAQPEPSINLQIHYYNQDY